MPTANNGVDTSKGPVCFYAYIYLELYYLYITGEMMSLLTC